MAVSFHSSTFSLIAASNVTATHQCLMMAAPITLDDDVDELYGDLPEFVGPSVQQSERTKLLEEHVDQLRAQVVTLAKQVRTRHSHGDQGGAQRPRRRTSWLKKTSTCSETYQCSTRQPWRSSTGKTQRSRTSTHSACKTQPTTNHTQPHRLAARGTRGHTHRPPRENRPPPLGDSHNAQRKRRRSTSRERDSQHRPEPHSHERHYHSGRR